MEIPGNKKKDWDILLMSEDLKTFQCHQKVLKMSSLHFRKIIEKIKEATNDRENLVLFMSNCTSKDLHTFIKYIYNGEIQVQQISTSLIELVEKYEIRNEDGVKLYEILKEQTLNDETSDQIIHAEQQNGNQQGSDTKMNFKENSTVKQEINDDDVICLSSDSDSEMNFKENSNVKQVTHDNDVICLSSDSDSEMNFKENSNVQQVTHDNDVKCLSSDQNPCFSSEAKKITAKEATILLLKRRANQCNLDAITPEKLWTTIVADNLAINSHRDNLTNEWESSIAFWETRYFSRNISRDDSRNAVAQVVLYNLLDVNLDFWFEYCLNVGSVNFVDEIKSSPRFQNAASNPEFEILQNSVLETLQNLLTYKNITLIWPEEVWLNAISSNIVSSKDVATGMWLSIIKFKSSHIFEYKAISATMAKRGVAQKALELLLGIHLNHWNFVNETKISLLIENVNSIQRKSLMQDRTEATYADRIESNNVLTYNNGRTYNNFIAFNQQIAERFLKKMSVKNPTYKATPLELLYVLWQKKVRIKTERTRRIYKSTIELCDFTFIASAESGQIAKHSVTETVFRKFMGINLPYWNYARHDTWNNLDSWDKNKRRSSEMENNQNPNQSVKRLKKY